MKEFNSSTNPLTHNTDYDPSKVSIKKAQTFVKKNGNNVNIFGDNSGDSYLKSPTKKKNEGCDQFNMKTSVFNTQPAEAQAPKRLNPTRSTKAQALVGKCPMNHVATVHNSKIPEKREKALTGIFGSSKMADSLTGANKTQ